MPALPDFFLVNPVGRSFRISDHFNAPRAYTFAPTKKQLHEGVDIVAVDAQGNSVSVLAAQRGVVDLVGFSAQGYGNYVRIVHEWGGDKWVTWYGHLDSVTAQKGQFVQAGQKIGIAGTTGFSTGVHLHLTLQLIGKGLKGYTVDDVVDPEPIFKLNQTTVIDEVSFVSDVTFPDNTVVKPGQAFTKTWRVRNTGTTPWDGGYKLVFSGQNKMGGPDEATLPVVPIQPGQTVDLTVNLTAPLTTGTHRGAWQLRNPNGELIPNNLFVQVQIKEVKPFDLADFVSDVTIPDGTIIMPGKTFVKTWRVRNTGTITWNNNYTLRFVSDDKMGAPDSIPLMGNVKPGEFLELSVEFTAPEKAGRHRSSWKLFNAEGKVFDFVQYVEIQVPQQVAPNQKRSEMQWIADVTIPDETPITAGDKFIKTWRVRNSGQSTWGPGYVLAFFGDDKMGGPDSIPLPPAKPGETVEISLSLTAPAKTGLQRSTWKARDPQGKFFEFDLFTLINVKPATLGKTQLDEMNWVADVTVPDGTRMSPSQKFIKTWRVRNTGSTTWDAGYTLAFVADERMGGPNSIALPLTKPGELADISLSLTAPTAPGLYKSTWKGRDPQGKVFQYDLFALIEVFDPSQMFDMLPFLQGDGRLYELEFNWSGGGRQRVQTQTDGGRFFHVKHSEWEELWADDRFVFRGLDTSPGSGEVYELSENGIHGSAWLPRQMTVGVMFRRTPLVVFRRKSDGLEVPNKKFTHVTWIKLEAVHSRFKLSSGIELSDVAVLAAYEDASGKAKDKPFERYYYAQKYGLVAWEGDIGHSVLVQEFAPGSQPDNKRELIGWLR
ncbi:MAG: peptidoglycan DD-metalloendopeptidase family protein [Chloroflexi bacterium]|nr:peptidoglycan DD-metalloendopeptidase family protein [Chloroflexota bacterium]